MSCAVIIMTQEEVQQFERDTEEGFGALNTEKGPLPLKAMDVAARIDGLAATTTVIQSFVNTLTEPLEATYIFPLPDRAAVTKFRMEVAGRVIEGVLKERGEARREYDQAIQQGHRAAITEEERPNVFTMRVGNLMPGETAKVHLEMVGPLPYSDGEATFRFPLVVAPRYIPGIPLAGPSVGDGVVQDTDAVPDASRITPPVLLPGYPNPVRLSLAVDVVPSSLPLGAFRSSLHSVVTKEKDRVQRIQLQPGERLDRDFILRFQLGENAVRSSLVLKPDADGKEGTFLLTMVPPVAQSKALRPRDVVFVLDRSGSMEGWKMTAARRALARMVDTLSDKDRFTVLAFDDSIETPREFRGSQLVPATNRNRFRAVEFLAKIDSRGGTELAEPLRRAVMELAKPDGITPKPDGITPKPDGEQSEPSGYRDKILVLITDGQVGNEDQILRDLARSLAGMRIFTLGIDQAVNDAFLKRLAQLGGGACELVESEDRLDEVMDKIHRRIATPVLTNLHLEASGLKFDKETIVPSRLPDLFAGAALCLMGRYRGQAAGSLVLQAKDAAGRAWSEKLAGQASDNPAIAAIWAKGHLRDLEDQYVTGRAAGKDAQKKIVDISLKFNVLCRFTSFVAVDRAEIVNKGGQGHRITQPVEAPAGWEMLGKAEKATGSASYACASINDEIQFEMSLDCDATPPPTPRPGPDSKFEHDLECEAAPPAPAIPSKMKARSANQQQKKAKAVARGYDNSMLPTSDAVKSANSPCQQPSPQKPEDNSGENIDSLAQPLASYEECDRELFADGRHSFADPGSEGLLQRASRWLFGGGEKEEDKKMEPTSLVPYRQRVSDLLKQYHRCPAISVDERVMELGILAVKLAELIEDMKSTGIADADFADLKKLLGELRSLIANPKPVQKEVDRLWAHADDVLTNFVGVIQWDAAPMPNRREEFWV